MRDASLLGPWIRRFLTEHIPGERNLARNTQRSYRDTLRLLLPTVAAGHYTEQVDLGYRAKVLNGPANRGGPGWRPRRRPARPPFPA